MEQSGDLVKRIAVIAESAARRRYAFAAPARRTYVRKLMACFEDFLARGHEIALPQSESPALSVLLPVYNRPELVFACLCSLLAQPDGDREIIVVDDGSDAQTQAFLDRVTGIRLHRNQSNEGYIAATNRAAEMARGDLLLTLNSDTYIFSGALEAASRLLRQDDLIGAAGGRLILPDGTLQEAGCCVYGGGETRGIGRGQPPDAAEFSTRKQVDYVSGAFMVTRAAVWHDLGGFDAVFEPGYYEDADYCIRLAKAGFHTIYQPDAAVLHVEHGSGAKREALRQMDRNRAVFRERHARFLAAKPALPKRRFRSGH